MVAFNNIHVGALVDVCSNDDHVIPGKVKWKGSIMNRSGEWIGLELITPDGRHDGILNGRRYFQCKMNHGLFTKPTQVRFSLRNLRCRSRDCYKSSDVKVFNKETDRSPSSRDIACIPRQALDDILLVLHGNHKFQYGQKQGYHVPHLIGGRLKPAKQNKTLINDDSYHATPSSVKLKRTDPSYHYFLNTRNNTAFRTPSSIPEHVS